MKQQTHNMMMITGGLLFGWLTLSAGHALSLTETQVTDDTAFYQGLTELKLPKDKSGARMDAHFNNLNALESRFKEPKSKLPLTRIKTVSKVSPKFHKKLVLKQSNPKKPSKKVKKTLVSKKSLKSIKKKSNDKLGFDDFGQL